MVALRSCAASAPWWGTVLTVMPAAGVGAGC
jgi:hypothetical protein